MLYQNWFYLAVALEWNKLNFEKKYCRHTPSRNPFLQTDLVYPQVPPTLSSLRELKIPSNTAYIRYENQLFYAYNIRGQCDIYPVHLRSAESFDNSIGKVHTDRRYRTLTPLEVREITGLTGHAPMLQFYRRLYILPNFSYILLFAAIINGEEEKAKAFIQYELEKERIK